MPPPKTDRGASPTAHHHRRICVLDAPSNLGLSPPQPGREPGVRHLAQALRREGILQRLGALDRGTVPPPPYRSERDPMTGARNTEAIAGYSMRLAQAVGEEVDQGHFCVVLGGDCSILRGPALALRRRGRYGLLFIDGHLDFRHPGNAEKMSAAAGEELALVTGRGTRVLTDIDGLRPYVRDADTVAVGDRERDPVSADIYRSDIQVIDLPEIRTLGSPIRAIERGVGYLARRGVEGFWIHLDVDVLDSRLMPAVDSPQRDGLTYEEVSDVLRIAAASPLAAGVEVTIFDPDLDPDGHLAAQLSEAIAAGLSAARR